MKILRKGYSLVELLVVLALVSILTAIAMPNLVNLYRSFSSALELDGIVSQINALGYVAYESGRPIRLNSAPPPGPDPGSIFEGPARARPIHAKPVLELPPGWSLDAEPALEYAANGVCKGGHLRIFYEGEVKLSVALKAPHCQVSI